MAFVFRPGDLPKLDLQLDRGADFKAWKTQWEAYLDLSGLAEQEAAKQVKALTLCFSKETVTVVENLGLTDEQRQDVKAVVKAIQRYVEGHINESVERRMFRRRVQQPGECFDDFLVSLRELAKTCNFCSSDCTQKNMRDQIIEGLLDTDMVEQLLKERDLTLDRAISTCRAQEAAKTQRAEITNTCMREPADVYAVQRPSSSTKPAKLCPGCGSGWHEGGRQRCPAYNTTCHNCKKIGHLARVCRGVRSSPFTLPPSNSPGARAISATPFMASTKLSPSPAFESAPTLEVQMSSLNGQATVEVLPDSGADVCVEGLTLLKQLNEHQDNLLSSSVTPRAVNNTTMKPLGKLPITIKLGTHNHTDMFHIFSNVTITLLSWKAARGLTILSKNYPNPAPTTIPRLATTTISQPASPLNVQHEFPTVFDGQIKTMEGEKFRIVLTKDAQPFCVNTPRTVPFAFRDKLKAELELLQEQGSSPL